MFKRILIAVADISAITARYEALKTVLDERSRRLLAAAESQTAGKGGISIVAKAIGISRPVIRQGIAELKDPATLVPGRIRKEGGGRKRASAKDSSWSPAQGRGSGGDLFLGTKLRIPAPEYVFQFVVQHLGAGLQQ